MVGMPFIELAESLDNAGLIWQPEIGDEVSHRTNRRQISILVDPEGLSAPELRNRYIWLPTIEQLVHQIEARQAILFHSGLELESGHMVYKTVVRVESNQIECSGDSLRLSVGLALKDVLLLKNQPAGLH